jgi:predicted transcriptional regulator
MGFLWYNPIMDTEQQPHKVTVDIPQDVWEAVRELARAQQRSFVKELVWALQEYVRREQRRKGAARDD